MALLREVSGLAVIGCLHPDIPTVARVYGDHQGGEGMSVVGVERVVPCSMGSFCSEKCRSLYSEMVEWKAP